MTNDENKDIQISKLPIVTLTSRWYQNAGLFKSNAATTKKQIIKRICKCLERLKATVNQLYAATTTKRQIINGYANVWKDSKLLSINSNYQTAT